MSGECHISCLFAQKTTNTIPCNVKNNISATQKNRPVNRLPQFFVQFSIDNSG
ncbi:TPA: hypothetical protein I7108_001561 [Vibrio cholerae O1]|nr:hypothetical protein [Vibrio cholerae O1]